MEAEEIERSDCKRFYCHMYKETPWGITCGMYQIFIDENNRIMMISTGCWSSFIQAQNYLLGLNLKKEDLKVKTPLLPASTKPGDICPQSIIDYWK